MKPYFGLRGTRLNIVISLVAGLDFLYVGIAPVDCKNADYALYRLFGYDQYVSEGVSNVISLTLFN